MGAPPSGQRLFVGLVLAWLAMSSSALFIVLASPLHPLVIAAVRVGVTSLVWAGLAVRASARADWVGVPRELRGLVVVVGLLLGLHFAAWVWCLDLTTVAHGSVFVATQPLFAGLFGRFLGDRIGWRVVVGIAVALGGTALMNWPGLESSAGSDPSKGASWTGDLLAVGAAVVAAIYLLAGRGVGRRVDLATYLACVNGVACVALLLAALAAGVEWFPAEADAGDWLAVVWLGLVPGFVGHGVMNWAARHLAVHTVSMAVLLEPIGATLLAWAVLAQGVGPLEVAGGVVMLVGAGFGLFGERREPLPAKLGAKGIPPAPHPPRD